MWRLEWTHIKEVCIMCCLHPLLVIPSHLLVLHLSDLTYPRRPYEQRQDVLSAVPALVSRICVDLPLANARAHYLVPQMSVDDQSVDLSGIAEPSIVEPTVLDDLSELETSSPLLPLLMLRVLRLLVLVG